MVLLTDGFFEATNAADQQFGSLSVEQFVCGHHQLPLDEFIKKLYQQVETHAAGQAQGDDLTAVVIKRTTDGG